MVNMRVAAFAVAALSVVVIFSTAVEAKPVRLSTADDGWAVRMGLHSPSGSSSSFSSAPERATRSQSRSSSGVGPRPSAWCGWWMRTQRGGGPEYNLAANWRRYGRPGSPQVGAVVVWDHHVGQIVGRASNGQWLVQSGNDGGAVRTRARSIAGATVRV